MRYEIFPSMYVRNLRKEKDIEIFLNAARAERHRFGLEVRSLLVREKLNCQSFLLRVIFLRRFPIAGPQFQSALNVSCSYLQVLGSPTCPCKYLKTLVIHTLKRLASAVQLRPWPPSF